ncbi:MAG: DUF952 domain-containing protein [Chloroflexota bacterium]
MGRGVSRDGYDHLSGAPVNIYHITSRKAWTDAARSGSYAAESLESEGFIHCSTAAQILPVARRFYRGQAGLVLLVIDTRRLAAEVKWEGAAAPDGLAERGAFPHVYGRVELGAVVRTFDFEPNGDGEFNLPPQLSENGARART